MIKLDLLPVRPDLFDAGGLARALRGYLGIETGLKDYSAVGTPFMASASSAAQMPDAMNGVPTWRVEVDPRITDPRYGRPHIQCAVIRNLSIDESLLRAIMKLQESIHWALCRDRKFASLGCYELAALRGPVRYTLVDPDSFRFRPLLWGDREPVSPRQMLASHPKGLAYAHLVAELELLPALLDAQGQVLALPPIINADETKVTTNTRDLFLDATGPSLPIVERALAILATSLVELDESGQAYIERVQIAYPERSLSTPALAVEEVQLEPAEANRLLGLQLTRADCAECLRRMRHGVEDGGSGPLTVSVAAYRHDIMHPVDLIEDIAIAHGYHNFVPELVPTFTAGRPLALNVRSRQAAGVLTGLGFLETLSLVLTSEREHFEKLLRDVPELRVTVQNPVSVEQTMLRQHLYSSLLGVLAGNTDHPLPQRIFEVGDVIAWQQAPAPADSDGQAGAPAPTRNLAPTERRLIAGAICSSRAGYSEGRSALDALLRELALSGPQGEGVEYRADENPSGIPGRCAAVFTESGARIAELFELHPQVLENFDLPNPAVLFSLNLGPVAYH